MLPNRRAGVGSQVLETRGVRRGSSNNRRVLHGAGFFQSTLHTSDGGTLLANCHVDATNLLGGVTGCPVCLLVDNRVHSDSGLARLAVTNDELPLSAAHRNHGVNCLDSCLKGLVNATSGHNAGGLKLERTTALRLDRAKAINRITQRVNNTAEVAIADWHRENFTGPGDLHTGFNTSELAEDNHANLVLV